MASNEEWREIPGFPGYEASSEGRVRSWRMGGSESRRRPAPKLLKPSRRGPYWRVSLYVHGKGIDVSVHQAVLLAFVGERPEGMEGRHFPDRDTSNNRLENVSYSSHQQNIDDRKTHGTVPSGDSHSARTRPETVLRGEQCGMARVNEEIVRSIRSCGDKLAVIAARYGIGVSTAHSIRTRRTWAHVS